MSNARVLKVEPGSELGNRLDKLFGITRDKDGKATGSNLSDGVGDLINDMLKGCSKPGSTDFGDTLESATRALNEKLTEFSKPDISVEKQRELLRSYRTGRTATVGDEVVRNSFGEDRYRFPVSGQVAVVLNRFDEPKLDEIDEIATGEIGVVTPSGRIRTFMVDLRCYRPARDSSDYED